MKYLKVLIPVCAILLLASCKRDKFYQCICSRGGNGLEIYKIGRNTKEVAYASCKLYQDQDTSLSCNMEVRK